ncbi:hypothetical protein SS50377_24545 [Spironucleus salmonicida]|uniref:Uncharacterized protein n=1 Tax=Spironucleus salmonicida TaxID=348837 RepID=V6LNU4_9EUKA|nr:hypothetical protein SS50377_24545 [Spironucleus salmonicida]|eukprot:EST45913.1 hypothetical protein SS50377_13889 [Spironucleus salmonicida]
MRGNVLTSSPIRPKEKLQSVFTLYASSEEQQQHKNIPKRLVVSQLSFHDDFIRQKRMNIIDEMQRPESQQSQKSSQSQPKSIEKVLNPYILFEFNRPINYPVSDWQYFLTTTKNLVATDRKFTDVDFPDPYSWDKLIVSGNRLLLTDFLLQNIKNLDLSDNEIDDIKLELMLGITEQVSLEQSLQLGLYESLQSIDLSMNFFQDFEKLTSLLSKFPNLKQLTLTQMKFKQFSQLQEPLPNVQNLILDSNHITKQFLLLLANIFPNLCFLSLCNCNLASMHLNYFGNFKHLLALKIKDNPKIRSLDTIKAFLRNIDIDTLEYIDISVVDNKQNQKQPAIVTFSKDELGKILTGKIPDTQNIDVIVYERQEVLGMRMQYREKHSVLQDCLVESQMDTKDIIPYLESTKSESKQIRCKSMLATILPSEIQKPHKYYQNKLVRPLSNRKHFLAEDGMDYLSTWLRQQDGVLAQNLLIADSIQQALQLFSNSNKTRHELMSEINTKNQSANASRAPSPDKSSFFVTAVDVGQDDFTEPTQLLKESDLQIDQREISNFQRSVFDDSLLSQDLFERLNLVLGPTSELDLANHPIDTSGLQSFLPRGVNTNMQELYKALKQTLLNPQGEEFRIDDEEILKVLMDEVK